MVKTWAEKEMRNLVRMHTANLPVPEPILLRGHVLVMDFIGHEGWAAPKLKVLFDKKNLKKHFKVGKILMTCVFTGCRII